MKTANYLKIVATTFVLLLISCGESTQRGRYVCNCEQQKQLQSFVKESIKNANNMSDEEMEDVIRQLRYDGVRIYCQQKPVWINNDGIVDWKKQNLDTCEMITDIW